MIEEKDMGRVNVYGSVPGCRSRQETDGSKKTSRVDKCTRIDKRGPFTGGFGVGGHDWRGTSRSEVQING